MLALLAFAAALPLGAPNDPPPDRDRRAYEAEAAGRLANCGIVRRRVRASYVADLQDYSITVAGSGTRFSDAALSCVAEAEIQSGSFTRFADRRAQARYEAFVQAAAAQRGRSLARAWLQERGRLADLPVYDPQRQTPADFAAEIETFCGVAPGTFLQLERGDLAPGGAEGLLALKDEQFGCLIHAVSASDSDTHGIPVGFVGNEALADESGGPER